MAKRFIDSAFFRKPLVRSLQAPYKLLFIYLFCECDHAGIWDVEIDVANTRLGKKYDIEKTLKVLNGIVISFDGGEKWFLPSFIEFQYGAELNPSNRVHLSVLNLIEKYNLKEYLENKPLISPLQGGKDKGKDKGRDNIIKKEPKRDDVMDELAKLEGDLSEITKGTWSKVAKAKSIIKEVSPDVTPEEIQRRSRNYASYFSGAVLTCTALASHWARCATVKPEQTSTDPDERSPEQKQRTEELERLSKIRLEDL